MANPWDTSILRKNAEANIKELKTTIDDFELDENKVMVCGRGKDSHHDFRPRFSTPTVDIDSELYVTVDHSPFYSKHITRKGNYALCLIVDPKVPKKITSLGGTIYWFSPNYFDYDIPKITFGKGIIGNSGLASIVLASYFGAEFVLLSGIKLTGRYSQYLEGKEIVFRELKKRNVKIFSLDGILTEKISYKDWDSIKTES